MDLISLKNTASGMLHVKDENYPVVVQLGDGGEFDIADVVLTLDRVVITLGECTRDPDNEVRRAVVARAAGLGELHAPAEEAHGG